MLLYTRFFVDHLNGVQLIAVYWKRNEWELIVDLIIIKMRMKTLGFNFIAIALQKETK